MWGFVTWETDESLFGHQRLFSGCSAGLQAHKVETALGGRRKYSIGSITFCHIKSSYYTLVSMSNV